MGLRRKARTRKSQVPPELAARPSAAGVVSGAYRPGSTATTWPPMRICVWASRERLGAVFGGGSSSRRVPCGPGTGRWRRMASAGRASPLSAATRAATRSARAASGKANCSSRSASATNSSNVSMRSATACALASTEARAASMAASAWGRRCWFRRWSRRQHASHRPSALFARFSGWRVAGLYAVGMTIFPSVTAASCRPCHPLGHGPARGRESG